MRPEEVFRGAGIPHGSWPDGSWPVWDSEADDTLICVGVRDETPDVRTFTFAAPLPALFRFRPGQFLTFDFEIDGVRINRCYTIASTPTRPHLAAITVKLVPGGVVSPWLHQTMRPGVAVKAVGPLGAFTFVEHPAAKYLFLSGGSGITPLMSMARAQYDLGGADTVFVHSARTPADIIFRRELDLMAFHARNFRVIPVCEADSPFEPWGGMRGRINAPMLALIAPDFKEREIFVCGPRPYMAAVKAMLEAEGFDMNHYHEESFDFLVIQEELGEQEVLERLPPDRQTFQVQFTRSRRIIACSSERFVLDAAKSEGMRLPSSCTKGMCGTCKCKLVSGAVDMVHQGGIRQREIDQGMILICCSKPLSDLVIER
jgi:ferredoxin-NADP reductase